ncbi:hypothetical protein [Shewanella goraebulensis]|uniref:hypothetical protein n=1 Tax=Shewanella goraebulensis TaxID=3050637 RepID=UPI002550621A|nr:hypothetical protein [Shewanella goraebulensis]
MKKTLLMSATFLVIVGCNNTPASQSTALAENDAVPSWVYLPTSEKGLASSSCVAWGGNMAVARAQAIANAKADLALQIETRAQVMDKSMNTQSQQGTSVQNKSTFTQVSKQVAEQSLIGAIPKEIAFARIDNQKQLCALVEMENTKPIFDKLLASAGVSMDPNSEAMLYKEFRTTVVTKELEAQLKNQ